MHLGQAEPHCWVQGKLLISLGSTLHAWSEHVGEHRLQGGTLCLCTSGEASQFCTCLCSPQIKQTITLQPYRTALCQPGLYVMSETQQ